MGRKVKHSVDSFVSSFSRLSKLCLQQIERISTARGKDHEMSLIAVNICLVCNAFDTAAIPLSYSLCPAAEDDASWDASVAYRLVSLAEKKLQRGLGHAHITVAQLCVRATDLSTVKDLVRTKWLSHRQRAVEEKERVILSGLDAGVTAGVTKDGTEVHLPHISVRRSDALLELQKDVIEAVKDYQVRLGSMEVGKSTFHKTFPAESTEFVQYMMDYIEKHSGDNYAPHVTLGASPIESLKFTYFQETKVHLKECRLVVSHMGHYGSCFELLE